MNELYRPSQSMSHQSFLFCDQQLEMNAVQAAVLDFQIANDLVPLTIRVAAIS